MTDTTRPYDYECYCGCGGTVQVTFPGGFAGTTATVTPCPEAPDCMLPFEVKRSAILRMTPAGQTTPVRHRDGLVTFR